MSERYFVTQNFVGNPGLKTETDKTLKVTAMIRLADAFSLSVEPYARFVEDPIRFQADPSSYNSSPAYPEITVSNLGNRKIYGVDASIKIAYWMLTADGMLNFTDDRMDGSQQHILPGIFGSGELYLHDVLFTGHLNLKIGIRGQFESKFNGEEFYPEALIYYPGTLNTFGPSGSSDIFVQAKIGDAVLYITIFNITGQTYVLSPVYAAMNTNLVLGVNWEFLK